MGIKQYIAVILITVIASASITFNILQNRDVKQLEEGAVVVAEETKSTIEEQKVIINDLEQKVDELKEKIRIYREREN